MSWWTNPVGQFVRAGLAQGVAAAFAWWTGNLGVLHLPVYAVPVLGALLHAADEWLTKRLTVEGR